MKIAVLPLVGLVALVGSYESAQAQYRRYYQPRVFYQPRIYRPQSFYQPRVYQVRPPFRRDAYVAAGAGAGGAIGQRFLGPYGSAGGAAVGGYYGGRVYDVQAAKRYYNPRYMGTQTTTPYRIQE
jgi:hypothetical protein